MKRVQSGWVTLFAAGLACFVGAAASVAVVAGRPAAAQRIAVALINTVRPTFGERGQTLTVVLGGSGFVPGGEVSFGAGIAVNTAVVSAVPAADHILTVNITIAADAALGDRDVTVINPGETPVVAEGAFEVRAAVPGKLVVTPARLQFPKTKVGRRRTKLLTIKNAGQGLLTGTIDAPLKGDLLLNPNQDSFTLAPGRKVVLRVEFRPSGRGRKAATIDLTSSDPRRPAVSVPVAGRGI